MRGGPKQKEWEEALPEYQFVWNLLKEDDHKIGEITKKYGKAIEEGRITEAQVTMATKRLNPMATGMFIAVHNASGLTVSTVRKFRRAMGITVKQGKITHEIWNLYNHQARNNQQRGKQAKLVTKILDNRMGQCPITIGGDWNWVIKDTTEWDSNTVAPTNGQLKKVLKRATMVDIQRDLNPADKRKTRGHSRLDKWVGRIRDKVLWRRIDITENGGLSDHHLTALIIQWKAKRKQQEESRKSTEKLTERRRFIRREQLRDEELGKWQRETEAMIQQKNSYSDVSHSLQELVWKYFGNQEEDKDGATSETRHREKGHLWREWKKKKKLWVRISKSIAALIRKDKPLTERERRALQELSKLKETETEEDIWRICQDFKDEELLLTDPRKIKPLINRRQREIKNLSPLCRRSHNEVKDVIDAMKQSPYPWVAFQKWMKQNKTSATRCSQIIETINGEEHIRQGGEEYLRVTKEFYEKLFEPEEEVEDKELEQFLQHSIKSLQFVPIWYEIRPEEWLRAIQATKNNKSPGDDQISYEILKALTNEAALGILEHVNHIVATKEIPNEWKKTIISPIPKPVGDARNPANWRPISLTSCIGKVVFSIINKRLSKLLRDKNFINDKQSAFQLEKDCSLQAARLREIIRRRKEQGKFTHLVYVDYIKAYDRVCHKALRRILEHYEMDQNLVDVLMDIYENNTMQIRTHLGLTEEIGRKRGIPQGDPLSPLIFVLFLEPLLDFLEQQTYAETDDITNIPILAHCDDTVLISGSSAECETQVYWLEVFAAATGMKVNEKKTKYTTNDVRRDIGPRLQGKFTSLAPSESYTYLGYQINLNLDDEDQNNKLLKQVNGTIAQIAHMCYTAHQMKTMLNLVVISKLRYCLNAVEISQSTLAAIKARMEDTICKRLGSFGGNLRRANAFLYLGEARGGLGLMDPIEVARQVTLTTKLYKTLSDEGFFGAMIRENLEASIRKGRILTHDNGELRLVSADGVNEVLAHILKVVGQTEEISLYSRWVGQVYYNEWCFSERQQQVNYEERLPSVGTMNRILVATDGSTNPLRPLQNGYGVVVQLPDGEIKKYGGFCDGVRDNNIVEAIALEVALRITSEWESVEIIVDTKLLQEAIDLYCETGHVGRGHPYYSHIRRIGSLLLQLRKNKSRKISHIWSHWEDKIHKATTKEDAEKWRLRFQRYRDQYPDWKERKKLNEMADKEAEVRRQLHDDIIEQPYFWGRAARFNLCIDSCISEGNNKLAIKQRTQNKLVETLQGERFPKMAVAWKPKDGYNSHVGEAAVSRCNPELQTFILQLRTNTLPTRKKYFDHPYQLGSVEGVKRYIFTDQFCKMCNKGEIEDIGHVLFRCPYLRQEREHLMKIIEQEGIDEWCSLGLWRDKGQLQKDMMNHYSERQIEIWNLMRRIWQTRCRQHILETRDQVKKWRERRKEQERREREHLKKEAKQAKAPPSQITKNLIKNIVTNVIQQRNVRKTMDPMNSTKFLQEYRNNQYGIAKRKSDNNSNHAKKKRKVQSEQKGKRKEPPNKEATEKHKAKIPKQSPPTHKPLNIRIKLKPPNQQQNNVKRQKVDNMDHNHPDNASEPFPPPPL